MITRNIPLKKLRYLNACRLFLKTALLSKIISVNDREIKSHILSDKKYNLPVNKSGQDKNILTILHKRCDAQLSIEVSVCITIC